VTLGFCLLVTQATLCYQSSINVDVTDFVCPVLRAPFFEPLMGIFAYYDHGAVEIVIGATLLGHGYYYQNVRTKTAGVAVLIVLVLVSAIAGALEYTP
jgi:hypothetical protein